MFVVFRVFQTVRHECFTPNSRKLDREVPTPYDALKRSFVITK